MRKSRVVATLAACTAGLTAVVAVNRRAVAPLPVREKATVEPQDGPDAVVLPFARPTTLAAPAVEQPAAPARCGDGGGRTKAGAPCAARATHAGRCHHHRIAA